MIADDENRSRTEVPSSREEPTPPPVDPADRPTIEPTDALPTEQHDDTGPSDPAGTGQGDGRSDGSALSSPSANPGGEPAPPPVDPADRPTIEPTDALPTDDPHGAV